VSRTLEIFLKILILEKIGVKSGFPDSDIRIQANREEYFLFSPFKPIRLIATQARKLYNKN